MFLRLQVWKFTTAEIRQISFASDMIWRCFAKIWNWSRHWDSWWRCGSRVGRLGLNPNPAADMAGTVRYDETNIKREGLPFVSFRKTTLMWNHRFDDKSYCLDYSDIQLRTFITGSQLHFKKSISSSLWIFLAGIAESLRSLDHFKHWQGPCTNFLQGIKNNSEAFCVLM